MTITSKFIDIRTALIAIEVKSIKNLPGPFLEKIAKKRL
jgi:hypothetical protein